MITTPFLSAHFVDHSTHGEQFVLPIEADKSSNSDKNIHELNASVIMELFECFKYVYWETL
jgi:hypothetical protein